MKTDSFYGLSEEGFHRIQYSEWGKPNPILPAIVCVHGLTRNRQDFTKLANFLSNHGRHIYCPDVVGRGDSDYLTNPLGYTFEQYLADMTVMLARMKVNRTVDFIGSSMGGLIGMLIASLSGNPIRRLIMNDIGPQIPTSALIRMSKYTGTDPSFSTLEEAERYFRSVYTGFGTLSDEDWQALTLTSVKEIKPGTWVLKLDPAIKVGQSKSQLLWKTVLHPFKALEGSLFDVDLWEIWRKVRCPVLVIRGAHSDLLLPETVKKMQSIHPLTEIVEVPNAGHAPALMDINQHEIILNWINKT